MTCVYLDQGLGELGEVTVLASAPSQRLVLDGKLGDLTALHAKGINISYCLEYAAKLGKNLVTDHLVQLGVPVTRFALSCAAARRGPGIELMLAGLRGEHLAKAQSVAATFRMAAGDAEKAYAMLVAGVAPDRYFISGAHTACGKLAPDAKGPFFQEALDNVLPRISPAELAASNLEFVIEFGRPIHIERTLEILKRPVATLMTLALSQRKDDCCRRLRAFGAPIDDAAFSTCVTEIPWDGLTRIGEYTKRLCEMTLADGNEGAIHAISVAPLVRALLMHRFSHLRDDLRLLLPCVVVAERSELHTIVDAWNAAKEPEKRWHMSMLDAAHEDIDAVSGEFFDLSLQATP